MVQFFFHFCAYIIGLGSESICIVNLPDLREREKCGSVSKSVCVFFLIFARSLFLSLITFYDYYQFSIFSRCIVLFPLLLLFLLLSGVSLAGSQFVCFNQKSKQQIMSVWCDYINTFKTCFLFLFLSFSVRTFCLFFFLVHADIAFKYTNNNACSSSSLWLLCPYQ